MYIEIHVCFYGSLTSSRLRAALAEELQQKVYGHPLMQLIRNHPQARGYGQNYEVA